MRGITRRQFLYLMSVVAAGSVGALAVDRLYVKGPLPSDVTPGTPSDDVLDTLTSLVEALFIGYPLSGTAHYRSFFQLQAENTDNLLGWFQETSSALNRSAQEAYNQPFAELSVEDRRTVVDEMVAYYSQPVQFGREARVVARVLRYCLIYYVYTDAHLILNFNGWPGMPRGFEAYRQPYPITSS